MSEVRIGHWTKLGSAVREARTRRRWSQHDLAQKAGVSRSWLAKLEAGHRGAELEQVLRLLAALEITLTLRDETAALEGTSISSDAAPRSTADAREGAARRAATSALVAAQESTAAARRRSWGVTAPRSKDATADERSLADVSTR